MQTVNRFLSKENLKDLIELPLNLDRLSDLSRYKNYSEDFIQEVIKDDNEE